MTNLQLRILSAVVLAALVLALTWMGGAPFRVLAAVIAAAVYYEWMTMARGAAAFDKAGQDVLAPVAMLIVCAAIVWGASAIVTLVAICFLCLVLLVVGVGAGGGAWSASGFVYASLSGVSVALLRGDDHAGLVAILFLFAVVWATDILAYFVGRSVGGPKLAPSISPGKTRSGALGGAAGGLIAGMLVAIVAGVSNGFLLAAVALLLSIVSQAGDLFESWVKRRHGVKDSGRIIPGHGGVMDRVDGLVAAAIVLYLIGWSMGSADRPSIPLFAS